MRIAICDDDNNICMQIKEMLSAYFKSRDLEFPQIIVYNTGSALLDGEDCDIIFLDMQLPDMDGVDIGRKLKSRNKYTIIIVVTSYIDYLDDALRFNTFRYLTKPIISSRFNRNISEALELHYSQNQKMVIVTEESNITVCTRDIIMIETNMRGSIVHTTQGDFRCAMPISEWLRHINNSGFLSPHRSFIVNLAYVTSYTHSDITLLNGKYQVFISRRRYNDFEKAYLLYLEGSC
ncbi:MAG: LytTR family DNA-binding domain-containing protein [Lachnospiraceae bacterium]|nr:LytTR family DNA-binding domain-containing protein [Lachnospiraceae bacterium]